MSFNKFVISISSSSSGQSVLRVLETFPLVPVSAVGRI